MGERRREEMGAEGANAAAIMDDIKAGTGRFRELPGEFRCPRCPGERRVLSRTYVGVDDDGVVQHWIWLNGFSSSRQKIVPTAYALEVYRGALSTSCPRCKTGFLIGVEVDDDDHLITPLRFHVGVLGSPVEAVVVEGDDAP